MVGRIGRSLLLALIVVSVSGCIDLGGTIQPAENIWNTIRDHDIKSVRQYLADGGSPGQRSPEGRSLLDVAVAVEDLVIVQLLCEAGADPNESTAGERLVLHSAAMYGSAQVVKCLLDHAADPMVRDEEGRLAIHHAAANMSVLGGNIPGVLDLLLRAGNAIDAQDDQGRQPIHFAALSMDAGTVSAVLDRGGDVLASDRNGVSPLRYVLYEPRFLAAEVLPVMRVFLARGAEANWSSRETGSSLLHVEAWNGRLPLVQLLLEYGADPAAENHLANTPLHSAAAGGREDVVEELLRAGSPLQERNTDGETAAMTARKEGHAELADRMERGARSDDPAEGE